MDIQDRHDISDALLTETRPHDQRILRMGESEVQRGAPMRSGDVDPAPGRMLTPLTIRRMRWLDMPALPRVSDRYLLNQPASSSEESDPLRTGMRGFLPFVRRDRAVFVALDGKGGPLVGFAQFRIVGPDQRWVMESAGVSNSDDADVVVEEMSRHAVYAAGMSGVKRLYARVGTGVPVETPLRHIGFAPYMRERILAAPVVPDHRPEPGVRVQEQTDVWSIHQLYMASTPRQVQYAEALTSHGWDVGMMRRSHGQGCRGWIVADDHLAIAYARAISRRDAHVVEFMVLPEQRHVMPALLATAFADLSTMPARDVYVVVRDYQSECVTVLLEQGFEFLLDQDAHVKYTTASARSTMMATAAFAVEGAEPSAKRVPTFLHGAPDLFHEAEGAWNSGSLGIDHLTPHGQESDRRRRERFRSGQWSVD